MVNRVGAPREGDGNGMNEESTHDKVFQWLWTSLRGWLLVIVIVLVVRAIGRAYSSLAEWLEPFFESFGSSAPSVALAVATLIIVPWALGRVTARLLVGRVFQKQQGLQALRKMETKLTTELRPDNAQGYRVALIDWPSATVRSFGVVTATFREPESARELAAVFLPGTPDPSKGRLRVVAVDDLDFTDWTLRDLARFHMTFGSAIPSGEELS